MRGGRFVPEAVAALRRHREPGPESPVVVSATDPVNLTGILMPGERIAAILGNRVLYHQGIPVVARIKCYRLLRVAIPGNWIPASQPE